MDGERFYDAVESLEEMVHKEMSERLNKLDTEEACKRAYNYFNLMPKGQRDAGRDKLVRTFRVNQFYKENRSMGILESMTAKQKFLECVKNLLNYAVVMLKPKQSRPGNWETIMVNDHVYEDVISTFLENDTILEELGYKRLGGSFIYRPARKDADLVRHTRQVTTDLLIMQAYMELECNLTRDVEEVIQLPERSSLADPKAKDVIPDICESCDEPAVLYCMTEGAFDCRRKAWCEECNQKWHVRNKNRMHHQQERTRANPDKMIAGLKANAQKMPPQRPLPPQPVMQTPPHFGSVVQPVPSHGQMPSNSAHSSQQNVGPSMRPVPKLGPRKSLGSYSNSFYEASLSPHPIVRSVGLPMAQTEQALNLYETLGPIEEYKFEFKDALIAVSDQVIGNHQAELQRKSKNYRSHYCAVCLDYFPAHKMASLCCHDTTVAGSAGECCQLCAVACFEAWIKSDGVSQFRCPAGCGSPGDVNEDPDKGIWFFNDLLNVVFPSLKIKGELVAKFQNKLTMWQMARDPNFFWCQNPTPCSDDGYGFIDNTNKLKLICPSCNYSRCRNGRCAEIAPEWHKEHDNRTCEEYATWLKDSIHSEQMPERWLTSRTQASGTRSSNSYGEMVEHIKSALVHCQYDSKLSDGEIKKALHAKGAKYLDNLTVLNTHAIIEECFHNRLAMVERYFKLYNGGDNKAPWAVDRKLISHKVIDDTVYQCEGDEELISETLSDKIEQLQQELKNNSQGIPEQEDMNHEQYETLIGQEIQDKEHGIKVTQAHKQRRECGICLEEFHLEQLASLCCHDTAQDDSAGSICIACARENFEQCIQQEGVRAFACPLRCGAPKDVDNEREDAEDYFNNLLAVTFPNIKLGRNYIQRFERRLNIWRLSKDPQFFWCENPKPCSEESYGFIYEGDGNCIVCPECQYSRCRDCKEEWESEHIGKSCDDFTIWKRENSPEFKKGEAKSRDYLARNGISCPECKAIFHHARGGCMDYQCPECNFQFCSGCGLSIYKGNKCPRHSTLNCGAKGLHCHHPRNCNYYMRDRETADLEELLDNSGVEFRGREQGRCTLKLEDDKGETMVCQIKEFANGLCEKHYKENLVVLINENMIEVLPIMTIELMEGQLVDNQVTFHKEPHTAAFRQNLEKRILSSLPIMDLSAYRNF